MFNLSKMAINDLLKDFIAKPLILKGTIDNLHPDYKLNYNIELQSIKIEKDKDVPKKSNFKK